MEDTKFTHQPKCSQFQSSTLENCPPAVSKSKKKRLKRKKKIEEEAVNKRIQEVVEKTVESFEIHRDVTTSKECSRRRVSSEQSNTANRASDKCTSKLVERKSETKIEGAARELEGVIEDKNSSQSEAVLHQLKMDKPSRNDVIAQREAKKLAKLAKKNKSGGNAMASSETAKVSEPTKENISNALNDNTPKAQNVSISSIQPNPTNADLPQVKDVDKVGDAPSAGPMKTDKTREEVMAEREAKKRAKLAAKNKKKDPSEQVASNTPTKEEVHVDSASRITADEKPDVSSKETAETQGSGEPSKAQLRALRRAKQEAQRAAKKEVEKTNLPVPTKPETAKEKPKAANKPVSHSKPAKSVSYQPKLLSHLEMDNRPLPSHIYLNVHPAIVELGAKYAARVVSGSNARCIALLQALKKVIADFVTPREKEFSRAMESRLNDSMTYLNASRQSSVSMTNALKHVKSHLTQLTTENTTTDDEARRKLFEAIDVFIKEQIDVAGEAIREAIAKKISNGDTIAIYGCSSLLLRILVESRSEGKDFEVVVVDGGPLYEGREMCRRLVAENIKCSYVLLPAFSYIVGQTTKILLGAHALLANGCVMSRSGTALVAMLAKAHNVPVIVCCETYKFCERVQADAFVHNELGPQHGSGSPPLISLMYDMTPPTLVDAVATELAILPCTSVPVILRVKPSDVSAYYY